MALNPAQCQELTIEHWEHSAGVTPVITSGTDKYVGIRSAMIGHYLTVEVEGSEAVSVDVSDQSIIGASVCTDATVTLHRAEPEPEVIDLVEVYPEYVKPIVYWTAIA